MSTAPASRRARRPASACAITPRPVRPSTGSRSRLGPAARGARTPVLDAAGWPSSQSQAICCASACAHREVGHLEAGQVVEEVRTLAGVGVHLRQGAPPRSPGRRRSGPRPPARPARGRRCPSARSRSARRGVPAATGGCSTAASSAAILRRGLGVEGRPASRTRRRAPRRVPRCPSTCSERDQHRRGPCSRLGRDRPRPRATTIGPHLQEAERAGSGSRRGRRSRRTRSPPSRPAPCLGQRQQLAAAGRFSGTISSLQERGEVQHARTRARPGRCRAGRRRGRRWRQVPQGPVGLRLGAGRPAPGTRSRASGRTPAAAPCSPPRSGSGCSSAGRCTVVERRRRRAGRAGSRSSSAPPSTIGLAQPERQVHHPVLAAAAMPDG